MSKLRKHLFGYTTQSVHDALAVLEKEASQLKSEVQEQNERISQLTAAIDNTKAEEELIREAIIDAKHLSNRIVQEARLKAKELVGEAEENLKVQFEEFKGSLSELEASRQQIASQKEQLYTELQQILNRYQQQISQAELDFEANWQSSEVDFDSLSTEEALALFEQRMESLNPDRGLLDQEQKNKQLIVFPKFS